MTWGRCSSRAEERRRGSCGFREQDSSKPPPPICISWSLDGVAWHGEEVDVHHGHPLQGEPAPWLASRHLRFFIESLLNDIWPNWLDYIWIYFSLIWRNISDTIKISPKNPFWETSSDCSWLFIVNPQGQLLLGEVRVKASLQVTIPLLPVTVRLFPNSIISHDTINLLMKWVILCRTWSSVLDKGFRLLHQRFWRQSVFIISKPLWIWHSQKIRNFNNFCKVSASLHWW